MGIVAKSSDLVLLQAVRELAEYLGENPLATAINVGNSFYLVAESWEKKDPKTVAEVHHYYRGAKEYLYNLVVSNYAIPTQVRIREDVERLVKDHGRGCSVLDVGAGIGSTLLSLQGLGCTGVVHADVGGEMFKYAHWRYLRAGVNVIMAELPSDYLDHDDDPLVNAKFDLVVCTEVIEHVVEPEKLVVYLRRHLMPGGKLVATVSFDDDHGLFPCHLNRDKWTNEKFLAEVMPANELYRVDKRDYVFEYSPKV